MENELWSRGADRRPALRSLDAESLFFKAAGETRSSFHRGTEVRATVTRVQAERGVLVRLDNGLPGSVDAADFSDDPRGFRLAERALRAGDQLACRVLDVDFAALRVRLTARRSLVQGEQLAWRAPDPCFQRAPEPWETQRREALAAQRERERRAVALAQRRVLSPFYRCVDQEGAAAELAAQPAGSCLFRPSARGLEQLVLTVKVLCLGEKRWRSSPRDCWRTSRSTRRRRTPPTGRSSARGSCSAAPRTPTSRRSSRASSSRSPRSSTPSRTTPSSSTSPTCPLPRESTLGPRRRPRAGAVPRESGVSAVPRVAESAARGAAATDVLSARRCVPRVRGAAPRGDPLRGEGVSARGELRELLQSESEAHRGGFAGVTR